MANVPLGSLGASAIAGIDRLVRKVAIDLLKSVVYKSPVGDATLWQSPPPAGYVGGRFRGNWQLGLNAKPSGEVDNIDANGSSTLVAGMANIPTTNAAGNIYYITNNLPYAQRLENGWSTQAPAGIVSLTVAEFDGIVLRART